MMGPSLSVGWSVQSATKNGRTLEVANPLVGLGFACSGLGTKTYHQKWWFKNDLPCGRIKTKKKG